MQQMHLVHFAPMSQTNIAQSVHGSPSKLYMPMEAMPNYTVLSLQPTQTDTQIQNRGSKRPNTDSTDAPKSKKRSGQNKESCGRYQKPLTPAVARRNERERNRVKQVNMGFETLRLRVPQASKNKKMSKVDTLRAAVDYINELTKMVDEADVTTREVLQDGGWSVMDSAKALMGLDKEMDQIQDVSVTSPSSSAESLPSPGGYSTDGSLSTIASMTSPLSSSTVSFASALESEMLDFTSWFQ